MDSTWAATMDTRAYDMGNTRLLRPIRPGPGSQSQLPRSNSTDHDGAASRITLVSIWRLMWSSNWHSFISFYNRLAPKIRSWPLGQSHVGSRLPSYRNSAWSNSKSSLFAWINQRLRSITLLPPFSFHCVLYEAQSWHLFSFNCAN